MRLRLKMLKSITLLTAVAVYCLLDGGGGSFGFGVVSVSAAGANGLPCRAPSNETGLCVALEQCEFLFKKLSNPNDQDKKLLTSSQCGVDMTQELPSRKVLVCCPNKYRKDGHIVPDTGVCGRDLSNRILGGNLTNIDEYPWMALISYKKPNNMFGFHCGGALINTRYVLTAGHCVKNVDMPETWSVHSVRLGEWDLTTSEDCQVDRTGKKDCAPPHVNVLVERIILHELYVPQSKDQYSDIAMLRLAESVIYSDFVKPICLPLAPEIRNSKFNGKRLDVAGWGLTEKERPSTVKLKIMVDLWEVERCQETYRTFQIEIDPTRQFCAGGELGIDTCRGDSGGPLMVEEENANKRKNCYIVGIVSYGPRPCGLKDWPGVYVRVGNYVDWIQSKLEP